jgi:uncharacterized protein YcbK (DUF882 family)
MLNYVRFCSLMFKAQRNSKPIVKLETSNCGKNNKAKSADGDGAQYSRNNLSGLRYLLQELRSIIKKVLLS